MKKVIMTLAFAAAAVVGANAQFLIGGNVGFEYDKTENVTTTEDKTIGFEIAPKLGYQLNENMSVGAYVGFGYTKNDWKNTVAGVTTKGDTKTTNFNIAPYFRYNCLNFGKFTVAAEAQLGFGYSKTADVSKTTAFGIQVVPFLVYNLNENWSIEAGLNFLDLGFTYAKTSDESGAGLPDQKTTDFGIGVDADNIFQVGALQFGATYKF